MKQIYTITAGEDKNKRGYFHSYALKSPLMGDVVTLALIDDNGEPDGYSGMIPASWLSPNPFSK